MDEGLEYAVLAPGSTFAQLTIQQELGRGPTGTVYRALDGRLGRVCAIKVIAADLGRDREIREQFLRGSRGAALFGHEHVLEIYDIGEAEGLLYLTTAFVDGHDLAALVGREGPMAAEGALKIVVPVAEALAAAHDRGLVHGNVKPTNILISREAGRVYLTDFGLGGALIRMRTGSLSSGEYAVATYVAPEQIRGDPIDSRTDVYALGGLLHYALTGGGALPAPAYLHDLLSIARALDPGQRFPSAAEFLEALPDVNREVRGTSIGTAAPEPARAESDELYGQHADVLDEDVQFTVYRPQRILPGRWYRLLAFAHKSEPFVDQALGPVDPLEQVRREAAARLGAELDEYARSWEDSARDLPRGSTLTFVPQVDGVEFNPRSRSFQWLEPVHQEEFRMRASSLFDGRRARGRLSVYFGSIIIAEVNLSIRIGGAEAEASVGADHAKSFRRIFVSYSHHDAAVVEQVETFLSSTGDEFVRDIRDLHAGEVWEDRIADMIRAADIFQLYWSSNSMRSGYVQHEWMYALSLRRQHFVRPTFWEQPMPALPGLDLPPEELRRLHFFYLPGVLPLRELPAQTPVARPTPAPVAQPTQPPSSPAASHTSVDRDPDLAAGGTFNIGSQNAASIQNVGGDMVIHDGIHAAESVHVIELRGQLAQLREDIDRLELPAETRAAATDALAEAEGEAAAPAPRSRRIAHALRRVQKTLNDAGVDVPTTLTLVRDPPPSESAAMDPSVATTFEIDSPAGQIISNIGGDQTIYYGDRRRATRAGKALAALGLLLSLVGLALLVVFGAMTAHNVLNAMKDHDFGKPYTHYLPSGWPAAVALIVSGFVVNRVARIWCR